MQTTPNMRIALGIFMAAHGMAHLVGFFRAWAPTRTTILGDHVDLGTTGIKIVGVGWALIWLAFLFTALGTVLGLPGWPLAALVVTVVSLVMCVLQLPETWLGVVIDLALLVTLVLGQRQGWFA